jgi:hypothetical protein
MNIEKEYNTQLPLQNYIEGTTSQTTTLLGELTELFICNDGANDMSITVQGKSPKIKAGEQVKIYIKLNLNGLGSPDLSLVITATTAYRIFISGV